MNRPSRRVAISAFTVACTLMVTACGDGPAPSKPPNVILISLDTVRRDAVGVYRESGSSPTPNLDLFAADCVRFDDVWAPMPFTLPSHMSIFTGLHPETHGVEKRTHVLDPGIPTVAELAAAEGFSTIGLVSNIWMKGTFGFNRGFDHYEKIRVGLNYADRINEKLFELLDRNDHIGRPLFVFLHYIDAHSDYHQEGVNALPYYTSPEYLAELGLSFDTTAFCDPEGNCATDFLTAANRTGRPIDGTTIRQLADLYTAGVRLLDDDLGNLFRGLDDRGLLQSSLVVITSDHGEEFREHGRFVHAQPYVESLAVPLLVRFPGGAHGGRIVTGSVELADLMPSMLAAMGIDPPAYLPSRDILSSVAGRDDPPPVQFLSRDKNHRQRFALRSAGLTLVVDFKTGETELYDRETDPAERDDISGDHEEQVQKLEALLRGTLDRYRQLGARLKSPDTEEIDPLSDEEKEQLRAIGYLE